MVPNRINKLQQRALRLEYKDTPFKIHQRNIQKLAIEMYQVNHKISPKLMCELFQKTEHPYNLRNDPTFRTCNIKHCTKNEVFH